MDITTIWFEHLWRSCFPLYGKQVWNMSDIWIHPTSMPPNTIPTTRPYSLKTKALESPFWENGMFLRPVMVLSYVIWTTSSPLTICLPICAGFCCASTSSHIGPVFHPWKAQGIHQTFLTPAWSRMGLVCWHGTLKAGLTGWQAPVCPRPCYFHVYHW